MLVREHFRVEGAAVLFAAGKSEHGAQRATEILRGKDAMTIARRFPGAPVCRSEERKEKAGAEQNLLESVAALQMTQLVAEDEFHLGRTRPECLDEIGKHDHEVAPGMTGCERIERP